MARFTAIGLRKLTQPGRYSDGARTGLWLQVRSPENRSWLFRYTMDGRSHDMGLGHINEVTLAEARELASAARRLVREGIDPIRHRREAMRERRAALRAATFSEAASLYIDAHAPGWRNTKHAAQWAATLGAYADPIMGTLPVATVATADVLRVLEPIWREKPETASRVRGRIEAVLDYAAARGWRTGENPARWKGHLANLLPARAKLARVEHHSALPWQEVPAFMAALRRQEGVGALALRFTILTAARTGETIGATWGEIDLDAAMWTVPAERMKAGREHRVPLPAAALAILREISTAKVLARAATPPNPANPPNPGSAVSVFPGGRLGKPLSNMALAAVLRRMGRADITTHGFRSAFRDWCAEATLHPREVAEGALAHVNKDKVEAAYLRSDLLDRRRALMSEWAAFVCGADVPA